MAGPETPAILLPYTDESRHGDRSLTAIAITG